ncbi:MAG: glutathione S-transferase family protein [Hyphomicrobium sp.]
MPKNKHNEPIELHFWPTPNGQKIAIALEELELPYVIHPVNITRGDQFKPEYLAISPNNKMPAIVDPNGPGGEPVALFESGAILQYLARRTGKLRGKGKRDRLVVEQWLFWQVAGFGPMAGQAHHFRHYAPEKIQYGIERYTKEVTRLYGVLDNQLSGRDFIANKYSIADIATYPWALNWEKQGQDISTFPNVMAWLARIGARPGVIRGMATGKDLVPQQVDLSKDQEAQKILFGNK